MTFSALMKQYFNNILQRSPTTSELGYWSMTIDTGALTKLQAVQALASGTEAMTYGAQIIRIYQAAFGRVPDTVGMKGWTTMLREDPSALFKIAGGFVNSLEWKTRYGDSSVSDTVLQALYVNVLGRSASQKEITDWKATGQSMGQILVGFSNSGEFSNKTIGNVTGLLRAAGSVPTDSLSSVFDGKTALFTIKSSGLAGQAEIYRDHSSALDLDVLGSPDPDTDGAKGHDQSDMSLPLPDANDRPALVVADSAQGSTDDSSAARTLGTDPVSPGEPATAPALTTLNGLGKGDRIELASKGSAPFIPARLTLSDTAELGDYLDAAAAGNGSTNGTISWFQFGGDTYIVQDLNAAATFQHGASADHVVKLVGLIDLSAATLSADPAHLTLG